MNCVVIVGYMRAVRQTKCRQNCNSLWSLWRNNPRLLRETREEIIGGLIKILLPQERPWRTEEWPMLYICLRREMEIIQ